MLKQTMIVRPPPPPPSTCWGFGGVGVLVGSTILFANLRDQKLSTGALQLQVSRGFSLGNQDAGQFAAKSLAGKFRRRRAA